MNNDNRSHLIRTIINCIIKQQLLTFSQVIIILTIFLRRCTLRQEEITFNRLSIYCLKDLLLNNRLIQSNTEEFEQNYK